MTPGRRDYPRKPHIRQARGLCPARAGDAPDPPGQLSPALPAGALREYSAWVMLKSRCAEPYGPDVHIYRLPVSHSRCCVTELNERTSIVVVDMHAGPRPRKWPWDGISAGVYRRCSEHTHIQTSDERCCRAALRI